MPFRKIIGKDGVTNGPPGVLKNKAHPLPYTSVGTGSTYLLLIYWYIWSTHYKTVSSKKNCSLLLLKTETETIALLFDLVKAFGKTWRYNITYMCGLQLTCKTLSPAFSVTGLSVFGSGNQLRPRTCLLYTSHLFSESY